MELLRDIAIDIRSRLATGNRMVILASGSTWNHTNTEGEDYGADSAYEVERDSFYRQLQVFIGNGSGHGVHGLVFISGDIHLHEIYQISLDPANNSTKVAPEFVSSPLTKNSFEPSQRIEGERIRSFGSKGGNGRRGFATLEIDTTHPDPEGHWSLRLRFHDVRGTNTSPYHVEMYTAKGGQFSVSD